MAFVQLLRILNLNFIHRSTPQFDFELYDLVKRTCGRHGTESDEQEYDKIFREYFSALDEFEIYRYF